MTRDSAPATDLLSAPSADLVEAETNDCAAFVEAHRLRAGGELKIRTRVGWAMRIGIAVSGIIIGLGFDVPWLGWVAFALSAIDGLVANTTALRENLKLQIGFPSRLAQIQDSFNLRVARIQKRIRAARAIGDAQKERELLDEFSELEDAQLEELSALKSEVRTASGNLKTWRVLGGDA